MLNSEAFWRWSLKNFYLMDFYLTFQALKPGKLKDDSYHSKNNAYEPVRIDALKNVRIRHLGSGQDAGHAVVVDETG